MSTSSGAELACSKQRAEYGYVVYAGVVEVCVAARVGYFETFSSVYGEAQLISIHLLIPLVIH